MLLIKFKYDWKVNQLGLGILRGLVGLRCFHRMQVYRLGFGLGLDFISYIIIYLRVWVIFLIVIARERVKTTNNFYALFIRVNLFLLVRLLITFSSLNYLLFYIRFEMSLIPTLILILG